MPDRNSKKLIRLLLVDDHFVVREGIRSCLSSEKHLKILGEASNGKDAIAKAKKLKPDIVLMDINMPEMNGIEATRELLRTQPDTKVLILTVHQRQEYVTQLMQAGARGYVLKDTSPEELVRAIETVHQSNGFFTSIPLNAPPRAKHSSGFAFLP